MKFSKLTVKFIAGFILLGVIICSVSSFMGYSQYKTSIQERYNDMAYRCAEVALSYVDENALDMYISLVTGYMEGAVSKEELQAYTGTEEYIAARDRIVTLRSEMGANDIYILCLDEAELDTYTPETAASWSPAWYIFDSYREAGQSFTMGDTSPINHLFTEDLKEIIRTGQRSHNYFISKSAFGYNTSAILPVIRYGKVKAFVGVEIPMVTLQELLRRYIISAVLVTVGLIVVFLLCYMLYLYRSVVFPITLITSEAKSFAEDRLRETTAFDTVKTGDEIQTLASTIKQMQIDINDYIDNLAAVTAEKERIGAELNVAAQIQADMLPRIFPPFPDRKEFDIYASMRPAKEVGGDFYDFFFIDSDHLALVMADVSGKGVPAALFMVISKTHIKNRAQSLSGAEKYSPAEILGYVNDQLCEGNDAELFVTVWLCIIELSTGKCVASNAGHEYPAIKRRDGKYELYKTKNSPALAVMEGMKFKEYEFELSPGDSIFTYTDGVAEATDARNELFGTDRMLASLNSCGENSIEALLEKVKSDLDSFVGEAPQFDDITMLGFNYFGNGDER